MFPATAARRSDPDCRARRHVIGFSRISDLNYLYARHQISLMRADAAECSASRYSHRGLADAYAAEIQQRRVAMGGGEHDTTFG